MSNQALIPCPVRLDLHDEKSFKITVDTDTTYHYHYLGAIRSFPEVKWHAEGFYTFPATEPCITHFRTAFLAKDVYVTEDASVYLEYMETTIRLARLRETRRWKYLFDDPGLRITNTDVTDAEGPKVLIDITEEDTGTRSYVVPKAPYKHQAIALDAIHGQEFFALFMEMGTGKTKVVIDEISICANDKGLDYRVLIVCPKTITSTWKNEFRKWLPENMTRHICRISTGTKGVDQMIEMVRDPVTIKIVLMNYERVGSMADAIKVFNFDMMVVDESIAIKAGGANRTKAILDVGQSAQRRVILTGTPIANSITDMFTQFQFLSPGSLGYSTAYAFEKRFSVVKKVRNFFKTTGYRCLDELKKVIARHAFIVTKDQCLDLPDKVYQTREIEMGPEQSRMYMEMVEWFISQMELEAGPTGIVEAKATIARLMRLRQITQGFFRNTNGEDETRGELIRIPDGNGKTEALMEILEEVGPEQKVLVWVSFQQDIDTISEALTTAGISHMALSGRTPGKERDTVEERFNETDVRVMIGEAGTGGLGLTLLGSAEMPCSTVVYYSNDYSLTKRLQSEDRCHRIGQTHNVTYIDLVCAKSIDQHIAARLQSKKELSEDMQNMKTIRAALLGLPENGNGH